jgi:glutamate-ammonia-ligase adenylyltransferase
VHLQKVTFEISALSDVLIRKCFDLTLEEEGEDELRSRVAVIGMGKLGGRELNYSSDIDLIMVGDFSFEEGAFRERFERFGKRFIQRLSQGTSYGRLFRVDMNLRPWGGQGPLTGTLNQYLKYYQEVAAGWELQAWMKARFLAGNPVFGDGFVREITARALSSENRELRVGAGAHARGRTAAARRAVVVELRARH